MNFVVLPPSFGRKLSVNAFSSFHKNSSGKSNASTRIFASISRVATVAAFALLCHALNVNARAATSTGSEIKIPNFGKCLGVRGNSIKLGVATVDQACSATEAGQQYTILHNSDGSTSLNVAGTQLCIGITKSSLVYGAAASLVSCGSGLGQEFAAQVQSSGKFEIINMNSSMCLSLTNQSTANGTPIIQRTCGDNHDQEYQLPSSGGTVPTSVPTPAPTPTPTPAPTPTPVSNGTYQFHRTVNDRETGSYFAYAPPGGDFTDSIFGMLASGAGSSWASSEQSGLQPDTIYSPMVVAHIASPAAAFQSAYNFPYNSWLSNQSTCSNMMTGTYNGKNIWASYQYQSDIYGWDPQWGTNVSATCYVDWWVNSYLNANIVPTSQGTPTAAQPLYVNLDGWAVNNAVYGAYVNSARVAPDAAGLTLNAPLQTEAQLVTATDQFYSYIAQQYPQICPIPHDASLTFDSSQYALAYGTYWKQAYAHACGILEEDILGSSTVGGSLWAYTPDLLWWSIYDISWMGNDAPSIRPDGSKRIGLIRAHTASGDTTSLLTELMFYEIVKGPNFFFNPYVINTGYAWEPSAYTPVWTALGNPTADYVVSTQTPGPALYSRTYQGGIVYLNWTGTTQTLTLPAGNTYYDPSGSQVTQITLPDQTGSYVTNKP